MELIEKLGRKSVADFFKSIENFDESAIYAIDVTNKFRIQKERKTLLFKKF